MPRFFAKKTTCALGHKHDSKREAERCAELMLRFRAGEIDALVFHPVIEIAFEGREVVMGNGAVMRFTPDFSYLEDGKVIYEDVKAKNGYMSRDVPVKLALLRHMGHEVRITK